ncbi:MAG: aminoglycoside 3'-phosphotransferase [Clostridia bacterium]|nr:aminoglycoside 3'-phosphotransferase [Clostridia bacterium]
MQKTLLNTIPNDLPLEIEKFIGKSKIYDSSGHSGATVYFIDKANGYYLKSAPKGTLVRESEMTAYFHAKGLGAEVLSYISGEKDFLLTEKVRGEDCTHSTYVESPKRLSILQGEELRKLHELDYKGCPALNKTEEYFAIAERNFHLDNYDKSHFPDNFGYRSAEEAYAVLQEGKGSLKSDVLVHGDYCLPNVILDDWKLSGYIDVGGGGVSDRHIDLFWGLWSLGFNLKTDKYSELFLDAYGRDKVDKEILKIVAAAEVFG